MTLWNKISLGARFLFGGWDSALDYLLNILNDFLKREKVEPHVKSVYNFCNTATTWLDKLRIYIPEKWQDEYDGIVTITAELAVITADGQLEAEEIQKLVDRFVEAKAKWEEDDEDNCDTCNE